MKLSRFAKKFFSILTIISLICQFSLMTPVLADEAISNQTVTESTPAPEPSIEVTPTTMPEPTVSPSVEPMPTPTETVSPIVPPDTGNETKVWKTDGDKATTVEQAKLNTVYTAPQNDQVTVEFTKLPEKSGKLSVQEITLTDDQKSALNALTDKAYDITSDMADGTFEYNLNLPNIQNETGNIVYFENTPEEFSNDLKLDEAKTIDADQIKIKTDQIEAKNLDHFTIFIATYASDFTTSKTSYRQGETVYLKAGGLISSNYYRMAIDPPGSSNSFFIDSCITGVNTFNDHYTLASNATIDDHWQAEIHGFSTSTSCASADIHSHVATDDAYFSVTVGTDTTAPIVTGVTDNQIINTNVTPLISDPDDTFTATLNGSPFTSGTTISVSGSYTLVATDTHSNTTTVHFTIDKNLPVISNIAGHLGTTGETTTVSANVTDAGSGLANVQISVNGDGYVSMVAGTAPSYIYDVAVASNSVAPITYQIKATDLANNVTTTSTQTITVSDNDAPAIHSVTSAPNTTGDITTITADVTDNIGITSAQINIQGAGFVPMLGSGPYTYPITLSNHDISSISYTVSFSDLASNITTQSYGINPIDDEAPVITLLGDSSMTIERGDAYIDAGATALDNVDGNITQQIDTENNVNSSVVGDYIVTYNVHDSSLNPATEVIRSVHVIDTTVPIVTYIEPNPSNGLITSQNDQTFAVTTNEPVAWCKLNFNGASGFENGAGNWVIGGRSAIVSDVYHSGSHSLLLQTSNDYGSSNDYGYETVTLPSSGPISLSAWIKRSTQDGIYWDQQRIFITDTNGNQLANLLYGLTNADWTNVSYDLSSYASQTVRVYFYIHDDGAGDPSRMWVDDVMVNGSNANDTSYDMNIAGNSASLNLPTMADGSYSYNVTCADPSSNTGVSTTQSLTIDTVAPVITINPYNTDPTNQDVVVTASTDHGSLNTTTHTFTENGSFIFVATDAAGNSSSKTITITNIDKTAPIVDEIGDIVAENPYTVTVIASDNDSPELTYHWRKVSGPGEINFDTDSEQANAVEISTDVNGAYVLAVTVSDPVGNQTVRNFNFYWNASSDVNADHPLVRLPEDASGKAIIVIATDFVGGQLDLNQVLSCQQEENKSLSVETRQCGQLYSNLDLEIHAVIHSTPITIFIPGGTNINPIEGESWDGILNLPSPATVSENSLTIGSNMTVDGMLSFSQGITLGSLIFDGPVSITINNWGNKRVGFTKDGVFEEITAICQNLPDVMPVGANECKTQDGNNLVIWTNHFTVFTVYGQAAQVRHHRNNILAIGGALSYDIVVPAWGGLVNPFDQTSSQVNTNGSDQSNQNNQNNPTPEKKVLGASKKNGFINQYLFWIILIAIALALLFWLLFFKRRKKKNKK